MADYGAKQTDALIAEMEKRLNTLYTTAEKEMNKKLKQFMKDYNKENAEKKKALKNNKITQEQYDQWLKSKAAKKKWLEDMVDTLSKDATTTNVKAMSIVRGHLPEAYALNRNYANFQLEEGLDVGASFALYDSYTVENLINNRPNLLPEPKVNIPKDQRWHKQKITNAISQGILQGESIPDISKRLMDVSGMDRRAAVRNARTATTGAQNAGRVDSYKDAESKGVELEQMWVASLDNRTRHAHRLLDGQCVGVGESFEVEGEKIEYPGDPKAPGRLVYNCRCTLIGKLKGFDFDRNRLSKLDGQSYEEWKYGKEQAQAQEQRQTEVATVKHTVVNGSDISATFERRPDKFAFEIEDVINQQGFDGLPRVVSREEFDAAVKAANGGKGFIAQRTYSAPDQETLDAYRDQLYRGKWYVDCSTGGSQYGQGMYCAADYNGVLSDGIRAEMQHYRDQYMSKFGYDLTEDQWLENSSSVLGKYGIDKTKYREIARAYLDEDDGLFESLTSSLSGKERDRLYDELYELPHRGIHNYVETLTLDPSAKVISYNKLGDMRAKEISDGLARLPELALKGDMDEIARINDYAKKINSMDYGSYAAMKGYDAINAEGHGESGSYTVVLNRTKLIILGE